MISFYYRLRSLLFASLLLLLFSAPSRGYAQDCEDETRQLIAVNLVLHARLTPLFEAAELAITAGAQPQAKPALNSAVDYLISFLFMEDSHVKLRPYDISRDLRWAVSMFDGFESCLGVSTLDTPLAYPWKDLVDLKNVALATLPAKQTDREQPPLNMHELLASFSAYDQALLQNVSILEALLNTNNTQDTVRDELKRKPRIEAQRVLSMDQNHPNPFNPATAIRFTLPEATQVKLSVYDMVGREIENLAFGVYTAGSHEVTFEAGDLPSGTYLYRLDTPKESFTQKMLLLR